MSTETIFKCDNCGKLKQEANHWYVIDLDYDAPRMPAIIINAFNNRGGEAHACGVNCLFEMVARQLSTGKIERT